MTTQNRVPLRALLKGSVIKDSLEGSKRKGCLEGSVRL